MQGTDWTYLKSAPVNEQDDTQDRQADRQAGRQIVLINIVTLQFMLNCITLQVLKIYKFQ